MIIQRILYNNCAPQPEFFPLSKNKFTVVVFTRQSVEGTIAMQDSLVSSLFPMEKCVSALLKSCLVLLVLFICSQT